MYKYTSRTYDFSPPITYMALGLAPFFFAMIIIWVIGASKVSFIIISILSDKLSWRELTIDDDKLTYIFKIKPFRIIDTTIPWDVVKQIEIYPYLIPMGGDRNLARGLEPERKLIRVLGEGNERLLSTNITDFGQDAEIREIIEDICARKGIPCRQMWKEWGKKKYSLSRK